MNVKLLRAYSIALFSIAMSVCCLSGTALAEPIEGTDAAVSVSASASQDNSDVATDDDSTVSDDAGSLIAEESINPVENNEVAVQGEQPMEAIEQDDGSGSNVQTTADGSEPPTANQIEKVAYDAINDGSDNLDPIPSTEGSIGNAASDEPDIAVSDAAYDEYGNDYDDSDDYSDDDVSVDISNYNARLSASVVYYHDGYSTRPTVYIDGLTEGEDFYCEYELDDYYYEDEYEDDYYYYEDEEYDDYAYEEERIDHSGTYSIYVYGQGSYYGEMMLSYKVLETFVDLAKTKASIFKKKTFQIKPTITNPHGDTTYRSSNTKVAKVSATGKITGVAKGKAKITVKNGYAYETFVITVVNPYLNKKKASIYVANSTTLKVKGATGKTTFKSKNKKIATVTKAGKVVGKKAGTVVIVAKNDGKTYKCKVTVKNPALSKKSLKTNNALTTKLKMNGGSGKITWTSSDKSVATVSASGVVTGRKAGECTITAKRGKYVATCKVTVAKNYKGYYNTPDFGAIYNVMPSYTDVDDGYHVCVYKASKSLYEQYKKRILGWGYYLVDKSKDGVYSYLNDYMDVIAVTRQKGNICVVYGSANNE